MLGCDEYTGTELLDSEKRYSDGKTPGETFGCNS
jgi:hypothetical protein